MKNKWQKTEDGWISLGASLTARVGFPSGPLQFSHWSVYESDHSRGWGSGGTSSVQNSKKQAELEIARVYALKARGAA
jgi:hypothetical protein